MNLVELATELEYVPKDQLAQMSQDPSSRYPQYLVLSEIQRRTANEKAYAAARPQPTTTVAEEVVGGLTAYANTGQTALQQSFNDPFAAISNIDIEKEKLLYGRELTAEERLKVAEYDKQVKEKQLSLSKGIKDYFTQQAADIEMRRLESQEKMEEGRERSRLPKVLRDNLDTGSIMPASIEAQKEQQLLRESATTGTQIDTGLPAGTITTASNLTPITSVQLKAGASITNPPPPPPAPETDINKVLRLSKTLDMGSVPNISYTPTEIPTSMTTPVPELPTELKDFKLSQREYNAPTEEDRQRELDVYGLGSLAKAFGSSKNLGEAGAEIGEAAMGISAIKKDQRKEMDRIETLKRADEVQDFNVAGTKYGLESGRRQEQFSLDKAVLDIKQSDNQNEFNANLNLAKYSNELKAGELEMAKGLVNMEILREQVEATNNKTLGSLYNSIRNEISDLEITEFNFDDTGKPKDAKAKRYVQLIAQLQGIVGSLQKQGLLQETKPLYQGVN